MLRWIALSGSLSVTCAVLGLGTLMPLGGGMRDSLLAVAALSATFLFSSYDAYETQASEGDD